MVPAGKSLVPDPVPGLPTGTLVDHYRCLRARTSRGAPKFPRGIVVTVTDQFGTRQVHVRKPAKICVATDKNGEGVHRPGSRLLCYKIKPVPRTSQTGVQATDQFGTLIFDVKKEAELCVPAAAPATACPVAFDVTPVAGAGARTSATRIETGWTGAMHERDVPEERGFTVHVTCESSTPPCGVCTIDGLACAKIGRCAGNVTSRCDVISGPDGDDCGGAMCEVSLLPPMHVHTGGTPLCAVQLLQTDVAGSVDNEAGATDLVLDVRTKWYLGYSNAHPCPICTGDTTPNDEIRDGTCLGGERDGLDCDANGSDATFGSTSLDCPPQGNISGAGVPQHLDLTTGTVSLPALYPCDPPYDAFDCPCPSERFCDGSGQACTSSADCPACTANADCGQFGLCDGSHCSCVLNGNAQGRLPNACSDIICEDIGDGQGLCLGEPPISFCDGFLRANGEPILACITNDDCTARADDCPGGNCGICGLTRPRPCFLDPIVATGNPSTTAPLLVGVGCLPASAAAPLNFNAGLPGPERVHLQVELTPQIVPGPACGF